MSKKTTTFITLFQQAYSSMNALAKQANEEQTSDLKSMLV